MNSFLGVRPKHSKSSGPESLAPKALMAATELGFTYKSLSLVEQGFQNLKTVSLEMRPMYHQLDERIRSPILICFLAYYLQWHMTQRLKSLFASDGKGKERQWTIPNVLETLKGIQRNRTQVGTVEVEIDTQPNVDQPRILELLKTPRQQNLWVGGGSGNFPSV